MTCEIECCKAFITQSLPQHPSSVKSIGNQPFSQMVGLWVGMKTQLQEIFLLEDIQHEEIENTRNSPRNVIQRVCMKVLVFQNM